MNSFFNIFAYYSYEKNAYITYYSYEKNAFFDKIIEI